MSPVLTALLAEESPYGNAWVLSHCLSDRLSDIYLNIITAIILSYRFIIYGMVLLDLVEMLLQENFIDPG